MTSNLDSADAVREMRFLIVRVFGRIGRFALVQFEAAGVSVRVGNTVPPKKLQTSMGSETSMGSSQIPDSAEPSGPEARQRSARKPAKLHGVCELHGVTR